MTYDLQLTREEYYNLIGWANYTKYMLKATMEEAGWDDDDEKLLNKLQKGVLKNAIVPPGTLQQDRSTT